MQLLTRTSNSGDGDVSVERVAHITGAFLLDRLQGRGVGVALYVAFAALARKGGYAAAADACFTDGSTSPEARRVWASKEFRQRVDVGPASGLVGVFVR